MNELAQLAGEFLSGCRGQIFNAPDLYTLQNDPELADMVSIERAQQWEGEWEWREWCEALK